MGGKKPGSGCVDKIPWTLSPGQYPPAVEGWGYARPKAERNSKSVQSSTRPKAEENFARAIESNTDEAEEGLLSGASITFTHLVSWSVVNHCDG